METIFCEFLTLLEFSIERSNMIILCKSRNCILSKYEFTTSASSVHPMHILISIFHNLHLSYIHCKNLRWSYLRSMMVLFLCNFQFLILSWYLFQSSIVITDCSCFKKSFYNPVPIAKIGYKYFSCPGAATWLHSWIINN